MQYAERQLAGTVSVPVRLRRDGVSRFVEDLVAEEVPVALIYNDQPHVVMMATPADLEDFATGFSLSEEIVQGRQDLLSIQVSVIDTRESTMAYEIRLRIPSARADRLLLRRRNLTGRSGCGLCGAEALSQAIQSPPRVFAGIPIAPQSLSMAMEALRHRQRLNAATGATHAAAWALPDGQLVAVREDVGRHNALDKLLGAMAIEDRDPSRGFVVITSRASYEMVLKAATLGIPLLAAISAPTAYAIRLAENAGLTLIGFARGENYGVYSCPARIDESNASPQVVLAKTYQQMPVTTRATGSPLEPEPPQPTVWR